MKDINEIADKLLPQIEQTIWDDINWEIHKVDADGDEYNELSTKIYKAILTKLSEKIYKAILIKLNK